MSTPTYFEVAAADSLSPSLRAAGLYALSLLAQRRPWIYRLLENEDGAFAVLAFLLELRSFSACDASIAESLYGLRRVSADGGVLSTRQRALSALSLALLPFLRRKAERAYAARVGTRTHALEPGEAAAAPPAYLAARLFLAAFPWLHAASELALFANGVAYVAGAAHSHSPLLALLGLRLRRLSGEDMREFNTRGAAARGRLLRAAAVDAARPALLASLLGFKLLEWWFGTAEAALSPPPRIPTLPPPPPLQPAPGGVSLPADKRICPLCLRPRTNPALAPPSGVACCLPCLTTAVAATGRCPVTGERALRVHRLITGH